MKKSKPNALALALHDYFTNHLSCIRGMSPHTLHSYRDALVLLLRFSASDQGRVVLDLDLEDLDASLVLVFLQHLETERGNCPATRNIRLAAIHAFFRYLATRHPERLEQCQRIVGIPFKRTTSRPVEYLDYGEIKAVLAVIDRTTVDGRRDYALLATMFNTGARVQEILDLAPCDLQLTKPYFTRLLGKGRKERLCPLWSQTVALLSNLLEEHKINPQSNARLFRNHRGQPLTRYGVRYLLGKYCAQASKTTPSLNRKRLHPHSMRHSTAVHLLKSGVDLVTISQWLGHASVTTTNRYASVDLEMKSKAIAKITPHELMPNTSWRVDATILDWLESL